ncbi:hypothetical protein ACFCZ1_02410 [Streptomyces sp. NPDC056224]|uniref:Rv1733c family protein n=1 Tax=Streptomyces sp. NPDC056224 TaxID=3345750 RepID=UPI0035E368DB
MRVRKAGPWLWRWRRNPLRRRSYLVEGWIILASAVIGFIGAPLGGAVTWEAVLDGRARQRAERHLTEAVPVDAAAAPAAGAGSRTRVTVRWTAADGTAHTGRVPAGSHPERGAGVPLWTDGEGEMVSAPLGPAAARVDAAVAALAVTVTLGSTALAVHRSVRRRCERRRSAQWAREWARVAPEWDRRDA